MSAVPRQLKRAAAVGAVAASAVFVFSAPAFAHVSVEPTGEAAKGGYATVNFKVPNERDNASTTKLEVNFPTDHPLASVMPQPVDGWDVKVTKSKLDKPIEMHGEKIAEAVSKVTWTADDKGIEPGTFQQFPVSLGALPEDADQVVFKALQTYSNDEVVRWIEEPQKGAPEPESPAPVLELAAAADGHGGAASAEKASDDAGSEAGAAEQAAADSSDGLARGLGVAGILVGAAGVAFGLLAGRRRGESAS
ncbi:YcnI family protein [Streptomyces sp. B-S-A6]|uniref:YcnI family protein n=2 Tax=Streptomyces cavernicola TaxID=3043613 RepID=A0ABT6S3U4_9ACTN|nr:YcnI family protein [Streptomyces sp. B-S-A6]MDI3402690.1 YcnI family protein [Streptomyces sp. B-S-A6]